MKTYTVRLSNLVVYGYHGVHPEEKSLGQRFEMDIEFVLSDPPQPWKDEIGSTLSYVRLHELAEQLACRQRFDLIETLADRLVEEIRQHRLVSEVRVRVRKPSVPLPGVLDHVEAEVHWKPD
ncbi:MAG: dihydroneopterin aldolase [bacterium]|jgi:dihydroneopterin aldolase